LSDAVDEGDPGLKSLEHPTAVQGDAYVLFT